MPICNTDSFINKLQTKIDSIVGDNCPWCQISSGDCITFAIKSDGTLWTWGAGTTGALGNGTAAARFSPGTVAGGGSWCRVSSGSSRTAAIKTDGTLWTWGYNTFGDLGDGTTVSRCSPGTIAGGGTTWCQVSMSNYGGSAIKTDGTLWTWGRSNFGLLGDGTTVDRCSPGTVAGGGTTWSNVSNDSGHKIAIKTDGTLWTWGRNDSGQVGDGSNSCRCSPGTVAGGGTNWCEIFGGFFHTSAIKTDGTLWTWGFNTGGQLGNNSTAARNSPGTIAGGGTTWSKVSGTRSSSVAFKTDGTLWTWGNNSFGQLGDGTTVSRCSPGTIAGGSTTWCQVSGGECHEGAIKTDGTLWTWGWNSCGALGDGTTVSRCSPGSVAIQPLASAEDLLMYASAVAQITDNRQVSFASSTTLPDIYDNSIPNGQLVYVEDRAIPVISNNECWIGLDGRVLRSDAPVRTLFTWGINDAGQLGDGTTVSRCSPGTVAGGGTTWCFAATGFSARFAIKTDGTLWSWGNNFCGKLGDGTTVARCSPGTVAGGGTTWCRVSNAIGNSAAIKTDGTLWTWGQNCSGVLGTGTIISRTSPGTVAGGGTTWCLVNIQGSNDGNQFTVAIKIDGTLWTWGNNNYGQLGNGTAVARCSPGTIAGGGTTWCQSSAEGSSAAAIKTDGTLWTWGSNIRGQLGDGTTLTRCSPGTVAGGGTTWCQSFSSCNHTLAIKTDGTLWTWGYNQCGRLGDGTTVSRSSPGTVAGGGTTWCQSSKATEAIKTDGTLWTWGCNGAGSLGDGTTVNRCSPGTIAGGLTNWFTLSDRGAIQVQ